MLHTITLFDKSDYLPAQFGAHLSTIGYSLYADISDSENVTIDILPGAYADALTLVNHIADYQAFLMTLKSGNGKDKYLVSVDQEIELPENPAPTETGNIIKNGTIKTIVGWFANMIRSITGKKHWWEKPKGSIEDIYTQLDQVAARYGICSTSASTAAKSVELSGFTLNTGAKITVKFTVTNTAANPTLNVNSTGAKSIFYKGAAVPTGLLVANSVYDFLYDGTNWQLTGVELGTAINSTTEKTTLVDADMVPLTDSAASNTAKKITWNNIKNALKTFIYGMYHGYVTCSTAAGTTAKTVTLSGFTLEVGASVKIKFTNVNTAANSTLNVNSTGAKPIYYKGIAIQPEILSANVVYEFVYNGTQYDLIGIPDVYTKTEIDTQLNNKVSKPIILEVGTDLNDITEPGFYYCSGNTPASAILNKPGDFSNSAFSLFVERCAPCKQTFTNYYHNLTFVRTSTTGGWREWKQLSTVEPPAIYSFPLANGFSGFYSKYWKNAFDEVTVSFAGICKSGTTSDIANEYIGTLPIGFRSKNRISFPAMGSVGTNGDQKYAGNVILSEDGTIYAYFHNAMAVQFFTTTFSFIATS